MTRPACGNNPNHRMSDGDRRVVDSFRAYLTARGALQRVRTVLETEAVVGRTALEYRGLITAALMADDAPPADQTAPSRRAGLRDEIVKALGKIAPVPPVAHRREQADHVLAVLYREWPWLRAEAEDFEPAADQAALRDRIAAALYAHDHPSHTVPLNETGMEVAYRESADAVLAVLPAPVDRAAVLREVEAALSERAKRLTGEYNDSDILHEDGPAATVATWKRAAELVRRVADETAATETQAECTASRSGDCLREAESETACDTEAGECVHGGQPAVGVRQDEPVVTVHAVPLPGSNGISACCGRPPCEFVGERVTRDPDKVTCTGPAAGARQDGAQPS